MTKTEGLKEKVKKTTETKTVNYTVAAIAPTKIAIGEPHQIQILLQVPSEDPDTLARLPEFRLHSYALLLKELTDIRVPGKVVTEHPHLEGYLRLSAVTDVDQILPPNEVCLFAAPPNCMPTDHCHR